MRAIIVPNWMLYDMIRDMKNELKENIVRVETKVDKGIERLDAKIDQTAEKLDAKIDENSHKMNEILQSRDKVKITFSRTFAFGTILFSAFLSYVLAFFSRE